MEGEWGLVNNTLNAVGATTQRRGSLHMPGASQAAVAFAGTSDTWIHVRARSQAATGVTGTGLDYVSIRNSSNQNIFTLFGNADTNVGYWSTSLRYAATAGAALTTVSPAFQHTPSTFQEFDIRIQRATVTNPNDTRTITFYLNAIQRWSITVTDPAGFALPAQLIISGRNTTISGSEEDMYYQDVIVSDGIPTPGMELGILIPNAVGNYTAWNNDYTAIDEAGYDGTDAISASAVNDRESWTLAAPAWTLGDRVIYAVVMNAVAQTDLAGIISDFQGFARISAIDYNADAPFNAINISPLPLLSIWTENPSTGNPWELAGITGLELGVQAI